MATSAQAAALTEAHRVQQNKLGALIAYVTAQLWLRSIKADNIDDTAAALVARLIPLIRQQRGESARLARSYYTAFRRLEVQGSDGFKLPELTELNLEALETSLRVTGPVALKTRIGNLPLNDLTPESVQAGLLRQAVEETANDISGSAMRHTMNGARDEIQSAMAADPVALGYVRTTSGDPCFFCAMLASRGPVYSDDSFDESDPRFIGEGEHKVHDHCACGSEVVYSRATKWPGRAREFEVRWIDLSKRLGRAPTAIDWRRDFEGRAG
jgi:hypothetical protein